MRQEQLTLFCFFSETPSEKFIHNEKSSAGGSLVMAHLPPARWSVSCHFKTVKVQSITDLSTEQKSLGAEVKQKA